MPYPVREIVDSAEYRQIESVAEQLGQQRYLPPNEPHAECSILLGAFDDAQAIGFLRVVIQIIGSDEQRTPIRDAAGHPLKEGYVEAFGVLPAYRRQGIGRAMQEYVLTLCRARGCYQVRSHSPISSVENYALKLNMGYGIHPSNQYDSYYFIKVLERSD